MYVIRKLAKFEMAHKLVDAYSDDCKYNVHGHTYTLELFFKDKELDSNGFIVDFKKIKDELGGYINSWDHCLVLFHKEPAELIATLRKNVRKLKIVDYNPTAEAMCKDIYTYVKGKFSQLFKVRLHETDSGYAEFFEEE